MSYATGTTHYNLPQTVGSDKRDWTDTNQAFSDLDTAVYGAAQGAEAATSAIQSINSELDVIAGKQATDEENITTLNGKVSTLESTTSTLGAEVLDVRQDLQDNIESKHEASATSTHAYAIGDTFYYNDILYKATAAIAIGDTIVPTVNCMGITVMSQVSAIKGDLTASDGLGFEFMTDGDGNYGYRGADDSFVPFSHGSGQISLHNTKYVDTPSGNPMNIELSYNDAEVGDIIIYAVRLYNLFTASQFVTSVTGGTIIDEVKNWVETPNTYFDAIKIVIVKAEQANVTISTEGASTSAGVAISAIM